MADECCATVPPQGGNFEEYLPCEDDAVEMAQGQAHKLRLEIAATLELVEQNSAAIRRFEFANGELQRELDKLGSGNIPLP